MDLYQLKTFFVLSKVQSFTEASRLLFVTQSAISHSIKKLELSLDTKLVNANRRGFELTEAGKALRNSCEIIFSEIEKAGEDISYFSKKAEWNIHIGATVEFGTTILMKHIGKFIKDNKSINIDFLFSHNLEDSLIHDIVDFIIDCKAISIPGIIKIDLFTEQYVVIASPEFLDRNHIKTVYDLENVKILSLDKDLKWWDNFLLCFKNKKLPFFRDIMKINHIRGIINASIAGIGIGFVPKYTVLNELKNMILIDPFPKIKPKTDFFSIYIKPNKMKLRKNQIFIEYLKNIKVSEFGSD